MSGLNINPALITEEVLEGRVGLSLDAGERAIVRAATTDMLDEALTLVLEDTSHEIHRAVDAVVCSTVERLHELIAVQRRAERDLVDALRQALPSGVPVEAVGDDAIAIGEPRSDALAPLAVFRLPEGGYEVLYPDPGRIQSNLTDQITHVTDIREVPRTVANAWREIQRQLSTLPQT